MAIIQLPKVLVLSRSKRKPLPQPETLLQLVYLMILPVPNPKVYSLLVERTPGSASSNCATASGINGVRSVMFTSSSSGFTASQDIVSYTDNSCSFIRYIYELGES